MKAIVVYDTRHGSTALAAAAVARGLGPGTELRRVEEAAGSLAAWDLVVLGAPLRYGSWSGRAASFAAGRATELAGKRFACFALGTTDEERSAAIKAALPESLAGRIEAVGSFGGVIDESKLGPLERLVTRLVAKALGPRREFSLGEAEAFGRSLADAERRGAGR